MLPSKRRSKSRQNRLNKVFSFLARHVPKLSRIKLFIGCPVIRQERKKSKRAFCHVGHHKEAICCAPETARLPLNHIVGLLLHELGHLATGKGDLEADVWCAKVLGVPIQYKGKLHLEWVDLKPH